DLNKQTNRGTAFYAGCLLQLDGNSLDKPDIHENTECSHHTDIDQRDPEQVIVQVELFQNEDKRDEGSLNRHHDHRDIEPIDGSEKPMIDSCDRISRHR